MHEHIHLHCTCRGIAVITSCMQFELLIQGYEIIIIRGGVMSKSSEAAPMKTLVT